MAMKKTIRVKFRRYLPIALAALITAGAVQAQTVVIDTGAPNAPLYAVGPVYVSSTLYYKYSRYAYLYTADELSAAGIQAGDQVESVGWMKSSPNSAAGPASFTILMKNSTTPAYSESTMPWTTLANGASTVYSNTSQAIPATASPNYIVFNLATPFTYTGGSLEILTEWDISMASTPIATGSFEWENTTVVDRIYGMGNNSMPASLSSTSNNTNINDRRPVVQIGYSVGTGVGRVPREARIGLYPNPAADMLNVHNTDEITYDQADVVDLTGKAVLQLGAIAPKQMRQVAVAGLGQGIYFLRLRSATGTTVKKFSVE